MQKPGKIQRRGSNDILVDGTLNTLQITPEKNQFLFSEP